MEKVIHPLYRLGKHNARHDPRTLELGTYAKAVPTPPVQLDWGKKIGEISWGMMLNDKIGDCTCASAGHLIEMWTGDAATEIIPSNADIEKAYSDISGYDPKTGLNDNGAVEIDVLNYWRKVGIAGHKIEAFTSIDIRNHIQIKQGVWIFGGIYTGFQLPLSAQDRHEWILHGITGDNERGSWGGHAVPIIAYNSDSLWCVTWGKKLKMSWDFFSAYCDEAFACLSLDWIRRQNGLSVSNFSLAQLQADLKAI